MRETRAICCAYCRSIIVTRKDGFSALCSRAFDSSIRLPSEVFKWNILTRRDSSGLAGIVHVNCDQRLNCWILWLLVSLTFPCIWWKTCEPFLLLTRTVIDNTNWQLWSMDDSDILHLEFRTNFSLQGRWYSWKAEKHVEFYVQTLTS